MTEPRKPRTFVSELRIQIEMIDERITELFNQGDYDIGGNKIKPADWKEYLALKQRRNTIRNKIINHDP